MIQNLDTMAMPEFLQARFGGSFTKVLGPDNSPIASTIAMIAPFAVVPLASAFSRPPKKELLNRAFEGI